MSGICRDMPFVDYLYFLFMLKTNNIGFGMMVRGVGYILADAEYS